MPVPDQDSITWLEPWEPVADDAVGAALVKELERELSGEHLLYGLEKQAVARSQTQDDVLFALSDPARPLAVVHLTWSFKREKWPDCPCTVFYSGWDDFVERCMKPEHEEWKSW